MQEIQLKRAKLMREPVRLTRVGKRKRTLRGEPYLDDEYLRDVNRYLFIDVYSSRPSAASFAVPPLPRTIFNIFSFFFHFLDSSMSLRSTRLSRSGAGSAEKCSCEDKTALAVSLLGIFFYRYTRTVRKSLGDYERSVTL